MSILTFRLFLLLQLTLFVRVGLTQEDKFQWAVPYPSGHYSPVATSSADESIRYSGNGTFQSRDSKTSACVDYTTYSQQGHGSLTTGLYKLPDQRPPENCRTFTIHEVEQKIKEMQKTIVDPELFRLFYNTYPNTLDTAVKWKGTSNTTGEELTFLITGDINAMWLRDSANQLQSYYPLLKPSSNANSIASLYRGAINLHARYLLNNPFCNAFQPPEESGLAPETPKSSPRPDSVSPAMTELTFECKYELDSLAAFLQLSNEYYNATKDAQFFTKFNWLKAVATVVDTAHKMQTSTYSADGSVNDIAYHFLRTDTSATETVALDGTGYPVADGTGLIRSAFRPSDDSTIFQFLIPANMMFSYNLEKAAELVSLAKQSDLATRMKSMAKSVRDGIQEHAVIQHGKFGKVYAYEIDGFGSRNLMDDANVPSLLSAPFLGFLPKHDAVYQNTRKFILSASNPYYMRGPVISAVGGPHAGLRKAWPMANIIQILTSDDDAEITKLLSQILSTTAGLGLIHESINSANALDYSRPW
jgi:meiotically up-regulated gene 157 (Mug157) protein